MRLDRVLSNSGFGTRSEIKKIIRNGLVSVDGKIVTDASLHVDPYESAIEIAGERLSYRKFLYIMMNKPAGVISATSDMRQKTAVDLLPDKYSSFNLFPAGRLDIDTEGLLLLTNDGQMAHELLSPKKHVDKKYYALIDGFVTQEDVKSFKEGVILDDGYKTMPSELEIIRAGMEPGSRPESGDYSLSKPRSEIELILHEGKFHQVKRMFEAVGKRVIYLKRIQMGGLKLDEALKPGEFRELTHEEVLLLSYKEG
jgi:16S rRNA pseudouridine516 synthase